MLPLPEEVSVPVLADWAELWCLAEAGRASRAELARVLQDSLDGGGPSVDDVWMELGRRESLLAYRYPFEVSGAALSLTNWRREHLSYVALSLMASASTFYFARPAEWNTHARLFEHLSALALEGYIQGRAVRIGWPRQGDVPVDFQDMILMLRDVLNEAGPGPSAFELMPNAKDGGVDVVAWKPFADSRAGQLIMLGQCAVGRGWATKLSDFSERIWNRLLEPAVPPVRAFLTPFTGPDAGRWDGVCLEGGVVFDRLRLVEMVRRNPEGDLRRRLAGWCREHLKLIRTVLADDGWTS